MQIFLHIIGVVINEDNTEHRRRIAGRAADLTGIKEKTSLVRLGLEALIARESAQRLAALGGTEKQLEMIPRRREKDH